MPKDAAHLKQHRFEVEGSERLSERPISVRVYAEDDDAIRAMDDRGQYIRDLIKKDLRG
ncbi:MAG: Uncharacterised protein [Synechococcus sp. MIT S9220]|nr:MAG: Uncharacterised protein [Synechococcus sp. MIT S9220]